MFAYASSFCGSVMAVQFVRNTHYMFSVGKDRIVKYWDADKFELLLTLEGHHADVWCLAISSRGDFIVTGSHDRSIRRWDRTEEPFFIEVLPCFCYNFLSGEGCSSGPFRLSHHVKIWLSKRFKCAGRERKEAGRDV